MITFIHVYTSTKNVFVPQGGEGGRPISDSWLKRGERGGVWNPLLLADIVCEQPLGRLKIQKKKKWMKGEN